MEIFFLEHLVMRVGLTVRHYLWIGNLLVLGLIVWVGAGLAMSILGRSIESSTGPRPAPADESADTTPPQTLDDYLQIVAFDMFDPSKPDPGSFTAADEPGRPAAAPDSLRLRGIFFDRQRGETAAIIESGKGGDQDLYRVGDRIGSVEVTDIQADHVILRRNGQELKLGISMDASSAPPGQAEPGTGQETEGAATPEAQQSPGGPNSIVQSVGPNQYILNRKAIEEQISNLNVLLSQVMIRPYFQNGQPHGFRIASIRGGSVIQQIGFRRGDVVLQVNDVTVGNPDDILNMYTQMKQLETVKVNIERAGQPVTLTYSLK